MESPWTRGDDIEVEEFLLKILQTPIGERVDALIMHSDVSGLVRAAELRQEREELKRENERLKARICELYAENERLRREIIDCRPGLP